MNIAEIWKNIENMVTIIKDVISSFYNFFVVFINFLPSPFNKITLAALGIIIIIIIYKIIKK